MSLPLTPSYRVRDHAEKLQVLFNTPDFCVTLVNDPVGVEFCGSLKNVIALGAGFIDALGYGSNTKAALIRIGLMEMKKFAKLFYKGVKVASAEGKSSLGQHVLPERGRGGPDHHLLGRA